ncbi:MAG: TIGR03084 family protein [Deltaproteobacteria bacterium]|nr:TIGR03084 family protein [Deltaproteobacteria bacterium]
MKEICRDLAAEHESLDTLVADLDATGWNTMTPFAGWRVKDEISHVAYFDDRARLAAVDPEAFAQHLNEIMKDLKGFIEQPLKPAQSMSKTELLEWWRQERNLLLEALKSLDPKFRLPWYGPTMSAKSFATARLMETWAHGQDVVDALGAYRTPSDRLRHIVHLGVTTFGWSFSNRKMDVPKNPVRVELTSPSGELWAWGPDKAQDVVRGSAEDFCLAVCQRRHVADTDIATEGDVAAQWMLVAQAFAGPPATGPEPGRFPKKKKG